MTTTFDVGTPARTQLFIDGREESASETLQVIDPAEPAALAGIAAAASAAQAHAAVAAAGRAFPGWAARTPVERADLVMASLASLTDSHEADAEILTRENGKIRMESKIDLWVLNHRFELAAALAPELTTSTKLAGPPYETDVQYLPLGVVTIIVPFNWPLAILGASLPQALIAGNTVVVKPPPSAPLAITRVVQRIAATLPPGVLNVVTGSDAEIGEALVANPLVAKVCFTGSPGGGRRIMQMASGTLTRVALELGGNDPALILADAELNEAAFASMFSGIYDTTGQVCMAAKRLYVHRSRVDEIVDGLSELLSKTVLGHGLDPQTTMGPLHTAAQRDYVVGLLDDAKSRGAEIKQFGSLPADPRFADGFFLQPSVVLGAAEDSRLVVEEQFGPTIPILAFDQEGDAVELANSTWAGLGSSVWTSDLERAARVGAQLRSGYTWVNRHGAPFLDERAPFGGFKSSGMGREMGIEGIREFMDTHSVSFPVD